MSFRLEFYRTRSGQEPALEYIQAQEKAHRAAIGRALRYLEELGDQAGWPFVEYLREGIYELRIAIAPHQHRLLYFFGGRSTVVIASGLLKDQGLVSWEEIKRARRCRLDWLERFGGNP